MSENFAYADGVNKPKILKMKGGDGRVYTQLLKVSYLSFFSFLILRTSLPLFFSFRYFPFSQTGEVRGLLFTYQANDDLRQDAVMQQIFESANFILSKEIPTRERNLRVRTYKVTFPLIVF